VGGGVELVVVKKRSGNITNIYTSKKDQVWS